MWFHLYFKSEQKNKQYKQKQTYKCADTENRLVVTTREGEGAWGVGEKNKGGQLYGDGS